MSYIFSKLFKKAKLMGYDTIQYLNHTDMRCGIQQ